MNNRIDVSVVLRLQNGDTSALDEIYNFYKGPLFYYALSILRNHHDAEEVVQDTITIVYEKINQLRNVDSFHFWLFTIAGNECKAKQRAKDRIIQPNENYSIEDVVIAPDDPEKAFSNSSILNAVLSSFQKLSETYKETAELKFLSSFSMQEIADTLDIKPALVKSRIYEIRKIVKADLEEQGYKPDKYLSISSPPLLFVEMQKEYSTLTLENEVVLKDTSFIQSVVQTVTHIISNIEQLSLILACLTVSAILLPQLLYPNNIWSLSDSTVLKKDNKTCMLQTEDISVYKRPNLDKNIESIKFNPNPIAGPIEVRIYLYDNYASNEIYVKKDDKELKYSVSSNFIYFYAKENGKYSIQVGADEQVFYINSIDNDIPTVKSVKYSDDFIYFEIQQAKNHIDYSKSYVLHNGERIKLPGSHKLYGEFNGFLEVLLVDEKGNENVFKFEI
ncbi:RNA polymerase sigma factor (sigma-70 family) [Breznakia blatticola]|uniref:RNA polymerase sigma factor (Sigma-70 family) n=1 Tax=Breznakia blatticola TaxID=1754012 RepID=A0A4R7Z875_9FIRM|nr:sigma-70 family RNA polymerase sigma factor [Breznakia blatticola]TDW08419.1 RNA polymerase sigma factor (sigma-70 family) [Breznakia blatticola]